MDVEHRRKLLSQPDAGVAEIQGEDTELPPFEMISDQMAEILRRKTSVQRLRSVDAFWKSARSIIRASILTSHPTLSRQELNAEIARRISHGAIDHGNR